MSYLASNESMVKCPYCGEKAIKTSGDIEYAFITCLVCGRYEYQDFPMIIGKDIKDKVTAYLYYHGKIEEHEDYRFYNFIGSKDKFNERYAAYPWCHHATLGEIITFYPHSFSERVTRILLGIAKRSKFFGDIVKFTHAEVISAMFVSRYDKSGKLLDKSLIDNQLKQVFEYLEDNK